MNKLLMIFITLGSILSAEASVHGPLNSEIFTNKTFYEMLGEMFSQGNKPVLKDISNLAWSGRCFRTESQDQPTNAGYIIREKKMPDAGPIGNNIKVYEGASYWSLNKGPDFYDGLTIADIFKLKDHKLSFLTLMTRAEYHELKTNTAKSLVKQSGDYLVEEMYSLSSSPEGVEQEKIFARCYYFHSLPKE